MMPHERSAMTYLQSLLVPTWYSITIDGHPGYMVGSKPGPAIYCGVGELFAALRRAQRRGHQVGIG